MAEKVFKQAELIETPYQPDANTQIQQFLNNFKGGNNIARGGGWRLAGGGTNTSSFLSQSIGYSIIPTANNAYALGSSSFKWSNLSTVLINGVTPLAGTKIYYVADSSGGAVTRKLTFSAGILISET